jgi:tocopherol O-methyltransferase
VPPPLADGDDPEIRLAAAIVEVTRELRRTTPAPKAAPFFGLDNDEPYDLSVLDDLSSPGIFRKYELVLLLHSGLGGSARWLSRRLSCRVLGVDSDTARVRAAQRLSRRAGMTDLVSFTVADPEELAFEERVFTHVWIVEPPAAYRSPTALREAFRVLRSGGHCGLHTLVGDDREIEELRSALVQAGFVDVKVCQARVTPPGHLASSARAKMRQAVEGQKDIERVWRAETAALPRLCAQLFCRRE